MQMPTKSLLLAVLAGTSYAGSVIPREDIGTAAIIGTFTDSNCQVGQTDYSQTVGDHWGTCRNLPGNSLKVWWLAKGCTVLTFTERDCKTTPHNNIHEWNNCIDVSGDLAWWVYCI